MTAADAVARSYGRCTLKGDVIQRFYDLLMDSHPDFRRHFAHTDFAQQKQLLHQAVGLAILFVSGSPVGQNGLNRIRESHGRTRMNIPLPLYARWKQTFIQAIAEFDGEFSDELRTRWDDVLQKAIDYITGEQAQEG